METNPYDAAAKKALLQEIRMTKVLAEKQWLLEQAERL